MKSKWKWLPPWDMPSDPVQAVYWFLRWSLRVLVRYFWILIVAGVAYETYLNGIVGLFGTLFVGLAVWALLAVLLVVVNLAANISRTYTEISRLSQNPFGTSGPFASPYATRAREEENVVEGSIITDLDEERKKRRQEM